MLLLRELICDNCFFCAEGQSEECSCSRWKYCSFILFLNCIQNFKNYTTLTARKITTSAPPFVAFILVIGNNEISNTNNFALEADKKSRQRTALSAAPSTYSSRLGHELYYTLYVMKSASNIGCDTFAMLNIYLNDRPNLKSSSRVFSSNVLISP